MPFSHHSHSGQVCPGHAQNSLEDVVRTAFIFCLTEHMPRDKEVFYPKEVEFGDTEASHETNEIKIIIGFKIYWIRPASKDLIGSIHHMHTMPIDYDRPMYEQARGLARGTNERLFKDYFDA
ncbi:uncharacterized protein N7446_002854 [Penicillium canescens]|uniref:Histidinol-phosphatase n=1 Tax=Penicillium canescens TaxID=5083 RepID=A0AAD6IEY0_PENCN|nr:uncharacterized protein N7446_002854 [Penicillium canescens]KAJ6044660.1 hypothetical protein N7460_006015 [Penicillium canescens]KAJ6056130.1 hypothetical protein N7444_005228 [Penicillium canescens]KAJ6075077.1 hypothetical protein N7446_002854 [Penicillium canescens]